MARDTIVTGSKLTTLANAIRTKGGTSAQMTLDQMAQAVAAIPTGGGGFNPTTLAYALQYGTEIDFSGIDVSKLVPANSSYQKFQAGSGEYMCYSNTHRGRVDMLPLSGYTFGAFSHAFLDDAYITSIDNMDAVSFVLYSGESFGNVFRRCTRLETVRFGNNFTWCSSYGDITFESDFEDCYALQSVKMPTVSVPTGANIGINLVSTFKNTNNLTEVDLSPFDACTGTLQLLNSFSGSAKKTIIMPANISKISRYYGTGSCIGDCDADVIFTQTTPPTLSAYNVFFTSGYNCRIFVPDAAVADWQSATNWAQYASQIYPVSDLQ